MTKQTNDHAPHSLVRDLLPNYIDGLTSKESTEYIARHLNHCAECKAAYDAMVQADLETELAYPAVSNSGEKADVTFFKKVKQRQRLTIVSLVVALTLIALAVSYVLFIQVVPYPTDRMEVVERYMLSDGSLYLKVKLDDKLVSIGVVSYQTTLTIHVDDTGAENTALSFEMGYRQWERMMLPNEPSSGYLNFIVTVDENNPLPDAVYFAGWGSDKRLLLWQEGNEAPAASPELDAELLDSRNKSYWVTFG